MKRLKRKWNVIHKIFREGTLTHSDGQGMVRITFKQPTGGIRVRTVPVDSFDVDPPSPPSPMLEALSGGPVKRTLREEFAACADELFHHRKQCPDATATERLHREFLIGLVADDKRLQIRSWWVLMSIAVKAAGNLYLPGERKGTERRDYLAFTVGNELFVGWILRKKDYDPRYFGRIVRQKCIQYMRKERTRLRRAEHKGTGLGDLFDIFTEEEAEGIRIFGAKADGFDAPWHRKQRSDVGKKRGRYRRKGEPQK